MTPLPFDARRFDAVVIGASTGAPNLVERMITHLPADLPVPILIAQHMPPVFTESFAKQMDRGGALSVFHAEDGMPLLPGSVYVGVGHQHLRVRRLGRAGRATVEVSPEPGGLLYRPSVDELFRSAAKVFGRKTLAIVMSGMGVDGVLGARAVHDAGGVILTQSATTCVIYGMPRACDNAGLSDASLDPEQIRRALLTLSPQHGPAAAAS